MNGKLAKKLRKIGRKNAIVAESKFMRSVAAASLRDRIVFAWKVIFRAF